MDLNFKVEGSSFNELVVGLLREVLVNQHVIMIKLADYEAHITGQTREEILDIFQEARNRGKEVINDTLFEAFGPDYSGEVGL